MDFDTPVTLTECSAVSGSMTPLLSVSSFDFVLSECTGRRLVSKHFGPSNNFAVKVIIMG